VGDPLRAGRLEARTLSPLPEAPEAGRWIAWRTGLHARLQALVPDHAALVSALVLARKDGLDPEVREAFARAGTAHLLAISGFHVGVVALLLSVAAARIVPARRPAGLVATLGVWLYVVLIGLPDAAVRAALLLTLAAVGRSTGRPVHGLGALSAALVGFLVVDPGALARPGFQLSFAGSAGLIVGVRKVEAGLASGLREPQLGRLRSAVAAGIVATLATWPVAAWHFDRISLVGIPATLVGTPLVAAAIPGIFAALAVEPLLPGAAAFLAGAVDLLLDLLVGAMTAVARPDLAVLPVARPTLVAGAVGLVGGHWLAGRAPPVGRGGRRVLLVAGAGAAILVSPVARGVGATGELEIRVLDVGQGDAIAIRSPRGRWILVDAGPQPPDGASPHGTRVVRGLRRAGAGRMELVVVTHPDLDHIGGLPAVLAALPVRAVAGPGRIRGTAPYRRALGGAREEPAPWRVLERGDVLHLDGVDLRVLHPPPTSHGADAHGVNGASVVLHLRFGAFTALLTGDAPAAVEEAAARGLGAVDLLKVGHHGSATSSSSAFLSRVRPGVAIIPVGRRNRYGHPEAGVLQRLHRWAGEVWRTDVHGEVRIRARRDGSVEVEAERGRPRVDGRAASSL
jgi:competence protein ComEC